MFVVDDFVWTVVAMADKLSDGNLFRSSGYRESEKYKITFSTFAVGKNA
jgi:hypothetical protein